MSGLAITVCVMASGMALLLSFSVLGLLSIREREHRAATIAWALAAASSLPLLVATVLPTTVQLGLLGILTAIALAIVILWFLPIGSSIAEGGRPEHRVDERDIMFARARLEPGSESFEAYYSMRPEHRESDDRTRALPGLLSPQAPLAEAVAFGSAKASFTITEALRDEVDGPVADERSGQSATEITQRLKDLALRFGACDVGITELQPFHVYSHIGRGSGTWGDPIELDHRWAIAFTVEMDHSTMRQAPAAPVVAESARQYVESGRIGIQLAALIRSLGYPARAHIDGNYRVIAPLVARDAGLGEIGRMGILMTPRLGPRVRLGVVTTDLPLFPDSPGDDTSVLDFCSVCKKCADNCPTGSIPFGDREVIDGGQRWAIDADSCFRFWNAVGTDCGRCMTVCPYSHPDNLAHNLVRWAIRSSGAARRSALWLDDMFYGRRPEPLPVQKTRDQTLA
jgi:ferredoxin